MRSIIATKKLFLVQFLVEADVSEWPEFDGAKAVDYFLSALKLSGEDKKPSAKVVAGYHMTGWR